MRRWLRVKPACQRLEGTGQGTVTSVYRWPWLEGQFRRRPWIGLGILVGLVSVCVWILMSAPSDRSRLSGLPMGLIAVAGIVLFGFAALKYVQVLKRRRKRGQP
jgi:ABC-type transport system involved in cytochrome c biogenesis permease subunit